MKIGFIGLGIMGKPMALNLIKGGHELFLHSRSGVPGELTDAGGTACSNGSEAALQSDIIITMVPDTPDVELVLFGVDGVATGLARGKVVVDMSSISPIETKMFATRINELGADYLDAPVSGGQVGAQNATLTIMVGGTQAVFDACQAAVRADGQEHHAHRRERRRTDLQGRQPDRRGTDHRSGGRGSRLRVQGRRRSGQGATGADGRLRLVADSRSARRTDDQAHVRSRLSHRAAPEGSGIWCCPARAPSACRCPTPPPRRSSSTRAAPTVAAESDHSAMVKALEKLANHSVAQGS